MSDNPIKLWPGPCEDGRETYFAQMLDVPDGWEYRPSADGMTFDGKFRSVDELGTSRRARRWVQVRPPAKLPDPERLPEPGPGDGSLVTTWGEMKDRGDITEWERLRPGRGDVRLGVWAGLGRREGWPDNYPIRIRRKEQGR